MAHALKFCNGMLFHHPDFADVRVMNVDATDSSLGSAGDSRTCGKHAGLQYDCDAVAVGACTNNAGGHEAGDHHLAAGAVEGLVERPDAFLSADQIQEVGQVGVAFRIAAGTRHGESVGSSFKREVATHRL